MNVLSLFSGIGGLELGLERAGMTTVGQVEIDPFCRQILTRHWPDVPKHDDVRTAVDWWQSEDRPQVDVIAGGWPCQPFSYAGKQKGITDERWGWPWFRDVLAAIRPRHVIFENVAALLRDSEAFSICLEDLSNLGFDAEWSVVSACSVGAPHMRKRLFVVADSHGIPSQGLGSHGDHTDGPQAQDATRDAEADLWRSKVDWSLEATAVDVRDADGLSSGLAIKALGNAVVPQVAELIGRRIMAGVAA